MLGALTRIYLDGLGYAARNAASLEPHTIRESLKVHHRAKVIAAVLSALEQWGAAHWFDRHHLERLYLDLGRRRGTIEAHGIKTPQRKDQVLGWVRQLLGALNIQLEQKETDEGKCWRADPESVRTMLESTEEEYRRLLPSSGYIPNPSEIALFRIGIRKRPHL
jgi:hypothetical protein